MVQQVEASVILLSEVNVGHQNKDLDDAAEIFGDGVMEWCVSIWILFVGGKICLSGGTYQK